MRERLNVLDEGGYDDHAPAQITVELAALRIIYALSVRRVSSAQARKHAAPNDVFQLAAARSSTEPVEGTT